MKTSTLIPLALAMFWATSLPARADEASLIQQGQSLWAAGKLADAETKFKAAVAENPRSTQATLKLAGFQLGRNNFGEAVQGFQQAISLDNRNPNAWVGLGMAYLHQGKHNLADSAFDEAMRLDPALGGKLQPLKRNKDKG